MFNGPVIRLEINVGVEELVTVQCIRTWTVGGLSEDEGAKSWLSLMKRENKRASKRQSLSLVVETLKFIYYHSTSTIRLIIHLCWRLK